MACPMWIDLFAEVGGLRLGFERAGFGLSAAVELDPIQCAAHEFNFPRCTTICRDVRDISIDQIRLKANIGNERHRCSIRRIALPRVLYDRKAGARRHAMN